MFLSPLLDAELALRRIRVFEKDVVYVKGVFEACDGLGAVFALPRAEHEHRDDGGVLTIAAHHSRVVELDEVLTDLKAELGSTMTFLSDPRT